MKPLNFLSPGDNIAIAAPSSSFKAEAFHQGVSYLQSLELNVLFNPEIFEQNRYLAGSDQRRAEEFIHWMNYQEIDAVFFARGGYGASRILPYLDQIKDFSQKIICGYSDITAIQYYLYQKHGLHTFYGPVITELGNDENTKLRESFKKLFSDDISSFDYQISNHQLIKPGSASGVIIGGCLSIIISLMGTPYEFDLKDKILFIEDINEKPYAIDRMLTQLKLAGKLDQLKGLIVGSLSHPDYPDLYFKEVIEDIFGDYNIPIAMNLPFGHLKNKEILPLGIECSINFDQKTASIEFNNPHE
jgi:muramoyltetrapeptide carboxypeptidase